MKRYYTSEENQVIRENCFDLHRGELTHAVHLVADELGRTFNSVMNQYYRLRNAETTEAAPEPNPEEAASISLGIGTLESLHALIRDHTRLVKEVEHWKQAHASIERTLENTRAHYKGRIQELEEDQRAFLQLMDKARALALNP